MSKPLFAGLLKAFAKAVDAGPKKRVVLLDNAGFHTRPNLAVPDGLRLVCLPFYNPELQAAETPWPLVDDPPPVTPHGFAERSHLWAPPIVNKLVPPLDALVETKGRALLQPHRASERDQLAHQLLLVAQKFISRSGLAKFILKARSGS